MTSYSSNEDLDSRYEKATKEKRQSSAVLKSEKKKEKCKQKKTHLKGDGFYHEMKHKTSIQK